MRTRYPKCQFSIRGRVVYTLDEMKKRREVEDQVRVEFMKLHLAREESNTAEGVKALLAINGGGTVAMLGFMQALITKPAELALFKYYGANAMLMFCLGILFGALAPAARVIFIKKLIIYQTEDVSYPINWERGPYLLWGASICLFIVGVVCASFGIQHAFLMQ